MGFTGQSTAAPNSRTARQQRAVPRPREVSQRLPKSKVGWDRKFRTVMVLVFCLVGWLGVKAGLSMYTARQQASAEGQTLQALKLQNRELRDRERALNQPATIQGDARHLGMVMAGERTYGVIGSSGH